MANPGQTGNVTKYSIQSIQNQSFDASFGVLSVELLGYDTTNNVLRRLAVDSSGLVGVVLGASTPSSGPYLSLPFTLLQP